jgi:hypothetical protein
MKARLSRMPTSTTEEIKGAFTTFCAEYDPEIVHHYFAKCSWAFEIVNLPIMPPRRLHRVTHCKHISDTRQVSDGEISPQIAIRDSNSHTPILW